MSPFKKSFHKIRFIIWLISAYFKKHAIIIVLGLIIGILIGVKAKEIFIFVFPGYKVERIGIVGNYTQNSLPLEIQNLLSFGLTDYDKNFNIISKTAQKYSIKESGKIYEYQLKKNIFWQDKKPLRASDINYSFKDVVSTVIDPYTIRFKLSESFAPFPSLTTQPLFKKGLIGLGEYKVIAIENEGKFISKITVERKKMKIIYKFYPNENDAVVGFKMGEVDAIKDISNIESLKKIKGIKIIEENKENQYVALFINTRAGIFQEKSFRQALSYAIEDKLIKEKRAYGPISPNSWAYNPNIKTYDYNLDSAQKLLEKSVSGSESAKIQVKLTALRPYSKYSKLIIDSWKKLGIETRTEITTLPPVNFEVLLGAQEIPKDPDQYLMWHSTSKLNLTGYNNQRIDKLLEDGRTIVDKNQRKEKYYDFQKFLVEDSPVIFLYYPTTYTVTR